MSGDRNHPSPSFLCSGGIVHNLPCLLALFPSASETDFLAQGASVWIYDSPQRLVAATRCGQPFDLFATLSIEADVGREAPPQHATLCPEPPVLTPSQRAIIAGELCTTARRTPKSCHALTLHDAARLLALKRCTAVIGQAVVQRAPALVSVATKLGLLNLTEAYQIARAAPVNQVAMYFQSLRAATATTPESAAK